MGISIFPGKVFPKSVRQATYLRRIAYGHMKLLEPDIQIPLYLGDFRDTDPPVDDHVADWADTDQVPRLIIQRLEIGHVASWLPWKAAAQTVHFDVPPDLSSTLIWSPISHMKEIGHEEAFFRGTDHRISA